MNPLDLLILALAAFYLAHAITATKGPFGLFKWVRDHLPLGGLTTCFVCATLWSGLAFYILQAVGVPQIGYVFAAGGASVLLYRYTGGDRV